MLQFLKISVIYEKEKKEVKEMGEKILKRNKKWAETCSTNR